MCAARPTLHNSALAVLKAAREQRVEMTRMKIVKLLYFIDLRLIEEGDQPVTGATWKWDHYGPFDQAYLKIEDDLVEDGYAWRQDVRTDVTAHKLGLKKDIGDPLSPEAMAIVRTVVADLGHLSATAIKDRSYETPPMVVAQAGGERGVVLDLAQARRARRAHDVIEAARRRRAERQPQEATPGFGDALLEEMAEMAELRARVNREELGTS